MEFSFQRLRVSGWGPIGSEKAIRFELALNVSKRRMGSRCVVEMHRDELWAHEMICLGSRAGAFGAGRIKSRIPALYSSVADTFGAHVKRLREVRRLTQEELAERSGLASDTIRRLEHQEFSPSLRTLRKVCKGLELSVAAMFNSFELDAQSEELARIHAMLLGRSPPELRLVEHMLSELFAGLDEYRQEEAPPG
jgi:transcriptional regulator with XRE-family HTH domain